jgi:hypothetical protein
MLSWRRLATLGALLSTLAGCQSAHIKDAYISRDGDGVRRTNCIRPTWMHYYLIVELMSFKDDTLFWPYLYCLRGECEDFYGRNEIVAPPFGGGSDDLVEFGNLAPGKSDQDIALEFMEAEIDPINGQRKQVPLTAGEFRWDLYLDDEDEPRESVALTVDQTCECVGAAVDCD